MGSAGAAHSQTNTIAAENQYGATHQVDVAVQLKKFVLQTQALGIHDVIAIHASEKLSRAQTDGFIQASSETAIFSMLDEPDARIGKPAYDFSGTVGGAVVDDDQFPSGKLLGKYGLNRSRHGGT